MDLEEEEEYHRHTNRGTQIMDHLFDDEDFLLLLGFFALNVASQDRPAREEEEEKSMEAPTVIVFLLSSDPQGVPCRAATG